MNRPSPPRPFDLCRAPAAAVPIVGRMASASSPQATFWINNTGLTVAELSAKAEELCTILEGYEATCHNYTTVDGSSFSAEISKLKLMEYLDDYKANVRCNSGPSLEE